MTSIPRVSVVMPFHNVERFLPEAIESVLGQSFDAWELLLADDGATDRSTVIAREYAERYPGRIRYLQHPGRVNRGSSAARNLALRHATGEYVAFLDGDDVWLPHKLAEQVPLFDEHPAVGMMYGNTQHWYGWTGREEDARRDAMPRLGVATPSVLQPPELLTRILMRSAPAPCTCSVLVRRDVAAGVGGFEESFRRVFTDQAFYAKMILAAPVLVVDRCWDRYRRHADSSVARARASDEERATRLQYFLWLDEYLDAQNIPAHQLRSALRSARWAARHPRLARAAGRVSSYVRRVASD